MLTCAILGHFGYTAKDALTCVTAARGCGVPDTQAQTDFIYRIIADNGA